MSSPLSQMVLLVIASKVVLLFTIVVVIGKRVRPGDRCAKCRYAHDGAPTCPECNHPTDKGAWRRHPKIAFGSLVVLGTLLFLLGRVVFGSHLYLHVLPPRTLAATLDHLPLRDQREVMTAVFHLRGDRTGPEDAQIRARILDALHGHRTEVVLVAVYYLQQCELELTDRATDRLLDLERAWSANGGINNPRMGRDMVLMALKNASDARRSIVIERLREVYNDRNHARPTRTFALASSVEVAPDSRDTLAELERLATDPTEVVGIRMASIMRAEYLDESLQDEIEPVLVSLLSDPVWEVATNAAVVMGAMGRRPDVVVPRIIASMPTANDDELHRYLYALHAYGPDAREAIPLIDTIIADQDVNLRVLDMAHQARRAIEE